MVRVPHIRACSVVFSLLCGLIFSCLALFFKFFGQVKEWLVMLEMHESSIVTEAIRDNFKFFFF